MTWKRAKFHDLAENCAFCGKLWFLPMKVMREVDWEDAQVG